MKIKSFNQDLKNRFKKIYFQPQWLILSLTKLSQQYIFPGMYLTENFYHYISCYDFKLIDCNDIIRTLTFQL